jgi:hypothetical protein
MTTTTRARTLIGALLLTGALSACATATTPSATPAASPSSSASAVVTTPTPAASPTPTASATPAPTPVATPVPTDCAIAPVTFAPPSDRLVDVKVSAAAGADLVTFVFGHPSIPANPAGSPTGALHIATKPYTMAGSGQSVTMVGEQVVDLVFDHMSIVADTGDPTFTGEPTLTSAGPAFRSGLLYDASEGHQNWYLGFDGPGCVTVTRSGSNVVVAFAHD